MNIPDDLRYSVEHEWVRPEGVQVRVGITDYAQDALGDIVYVDLPAVGTEVEVGGKLGEVESTKSVSEIYAPVAGKITAVNDALPDSPQHMTETLRRRVDLRSGSSGRRRCQRPARPSGLPRPHRRLSAMLALAARPGKGSVLSSTVVAVFCNNCGHRNPEGVNFCSSCGNALLAEGEDATITLHPSDDTGEVSEEEATPTLVEIPHGAGVLVVTRGANMGARYLLGEHITRAGRHPESDIFLDDITVSRRHVEITHIDGGTFLIRDVGSLNGTYVNRERIDEATLLPGDEVQIGKFKLLYLVAGNE